MKVACVAVIVALSAHALTALPQTAQPSSDPMKEQETYEAVCGACHEANLIDGPLRLPAEWDEVISRMQSYGASGTPEQFSLARGFALRAFGKANVNTAPATDLAPVLDISAEQAAGIVRHREQNGRFASVDDVKTVQGLDPSKIDARRNRMTF